MTWLEVWAIGVYDLRLGDDWMERFTMREFAAISDRHLNEISREDFYHARTRQGIAGGKLEDIMVYKHGLKQSRRPVLLGPDGKPTGKSFGDIAKDLGVVLPEE